MDLVAEMMLDYLPHALGDECTAVRIQPAFRRRFSRRADRPRVDGSVGAQRRFNLDRAMNRFWDYPGSLRRRSGDLDLFHVVDHAYAQLVHALPRERTVVTCHDLHTFQCLLDGKAPPRSWLFRRMTRYVLTGLEKAARVIVDTAAVGDELVAKGIVARERIRVIHLGVHPAFDHRSHPAADEVAAGLVGASGTYLLHVGGTFARKRLDLLLRIFAEVRRERPEIRLVRVGGPLTPRQMELSRTLGIEDAILSLGFLDREVLAAIYRRAALVLLPSEEEGFGFPIVEAMKSGTPVIASDLPVLREVGGGAVRYVGVGDVNGWANAVLELLDERDRDQEMWAARCRSALSRSSHFSWEEYARNLVHVYRELLSS